MTFTSRRNKNAFCYMFLALAVCAGGGALVVFDLSTPMYFDKCCFVTTAHTCEVVLGCVKGFGSAFLKKEECYNHNGRRVLGTEQVFDAAPRYLRRARVFDELRNVECRCLRNCCCVPHRRCSPLLRMLALNGSKGPIMRNVHCSLSLL